MIFKLKRETLVAYIRDQTLVTYSNAICRGAKRESFLHNSNEILMSSKWFLTFQGIFRANRMIFYNYGRKLQVLVPLVSVQFPHFRILLFNLDHSCTKDKVNRGRHLLKIPRGIKLAVILKVFEEISFVVPECFELCVAISTVTL